MAMASNTVSKVVAALTIRGESAPNELKITTPTNATANQGMPERRFSCAPSRWTLPRVIQTESPMRKGASIITRTIFVMTAVLATDSLTERPAANTWATS